MKAKLGLPVLLMLVFALTRIPGLMPPNFSAVYGLLFCAGVYFSARMAWWLPLGVLFLTDVLLNTFYYRVPVLDLFSAINYLAYAAIILVGRRFSTKSSWVSLLAGGVVGAILFYVITNTVAWLFNPYGNPEYTRNLAGWITALTRGTAGYPQTWEFFRNTLLSGGLFTGLFAGAMKLAAALEPKEQEAEAPAEEAEPAPDAEEAKA